MSTYTSEPGTRLAGRYRLVDQTSAGSGWTYWKATDETLARAVTVLTFATGFPRITATVTAARAASRLNDTRFAQVFDVEDVGEIAYVVLEWVGGDSLLDMLAEGPLEPRRAVSLIAEAARALAAAHRAGLSHLRLDPSRLHWTPSGGVKITGLGVEAALAGSLVAEDAEDPAATDTRGLAMLLYAALTGYWPDSDGGVLPPAPTDNGEPCTPRQVAAGVPASIDAITCRALLQQDNRQGPALSTPDAFADALAKVAPQAPLPTAPYSPQRQATNPYPVPGYQGSGGRPAAYHRSHPQTERSATTRGVISAVIVLVLVIVGVAAWAISKSMHHSGAGSPAQQQSTTKSGSAAAAAQLTPAGASVYTVAGASPDNADLAGNVLTASGASQPWHTDYYDGYPQFGHLTTGMGLLLDMGSSIRLSELDVRFGTSCCTHAVIELGNSPTGALSTFTQVASSTTAAGSTTFSTSSTATGSYVLIWITYLPPLAGRANAYETQVYSVTVRGTSV
jgi:hypothetical protein